MQFFECEIFSSVWTMMTTFSSLVIVWWIKKIGTYTRKVRHLWGFFKQRMMKLLHTLKKFSTAPNLPPNAYVFRWRMERTWWQYECYIKGLPLLLILSKILFSLFWFFLLSNLFSISVVGFIHILLWRLIQMRMDKHFSLAIIVNTF